MNRGIEAFTAEGMLRKKLFLNDAAELKLSIPTEARLFFWTHAYYVDGEGNGKAHLEATILDYTKSTRSVIKEKPLLRLSTWRYVQRLLLLKK